MPEGTDDPKRTELIDYLAEVISDSRRLNWESIQPFLPDWTDHTVSDPGITLLQLFSWLTETLLYRRAADPPMFHRAGDHPEPLRDLLEVLVNEIDAIQRKLDQLYNSAFIETDRSPGRRPPKFDGPDLTAQGNEVAIESIELSDLTDPDPEPDEG